jgi:hypothetical protein
VRRPGILLLPITGLLWFALVLVSLDWDESIDLCAMSRQVSAECTAFHPNYLLNQKVFSFVDTSTTRK